ncbi:MAG TPA: NFACT family protein [Pyrinomonadaceae bacterium]|nr:NFACT family protein [Pyrinomonadaceae bacterium]
MDDRSIKKVVEEIAPLLIGCVPGKVFQLGPVSLAIDFRLREHGYLFVSVDPALPRLHLIKRRARDLEKQSIAPTQFALKLRKDLSSTRVLSVEKDQDDRIVRFQFAGEDELGQATQCALIAQLTGRASNLFWLDREGLIIHQARPARRRGQKVGEPYEAPAMVGAQRNTASDSELLKTSESGIFTSASEAADAYYTSLLSQKAFNEDAARALADLRKKISRQENLLTQLHTDLASHGDAEEQKHIGDLLLANLSTAKRQRDRVTLIDYFAATTPLMEIEADEKLTLPQEASRRFAIYSRSKRAVRQITSRIQLVRSGLDGLHSQLERLEKIIAERDEAALALLTGRKRERPTKTKHRREEKIPGTRRYLSSDGFEILVGRAARDNDHLTFKVARPNDLWLHAADYPGAHVVVRNSTRKELPHRTIIEAAQLAAHFSQAAKDPKVDVRYTFRKFLAKPKGAASGLVRLSRVKNITVDPREVGAVARP